MLIERFLPSYDFNEVHTLDVRAAPARVFQAIKDVTPAEIRGLQQLLALRTLPARLAGRVGARGPAERPMLAQMLKSGFILLAEQPDHELVIGTIGQFWKLVPGDSSSPATVTNAQEFLAFDRPDHAQAVMNFFLDEGSNGKPVTVRTETRIRIPDPRARLKFAFYWLLISTGSALIRLAWLRAIKRRAERG